MIFDERNAQLGCRLSDLPFAAAPSEGSLTSSGKPGAGQVSKLCGLKG